ncbi:MAG: Do family serine endopeptidase [Verrucomicrobiaceae bacterium]|nr:Do family serine endopeptidase [Verrucomicrobiaceae bacterium]
MKHTAPIVTAITLALSLARAEQIDSNAFNSKLTKDAAPLPNGGQIQMSYANVAEKILPSVVTIFSSAPIKAPTADKIPPQLRPFFYRFFGVPDEDFGMDENDEPQAPRGRGRGQPMPDEMPEHQNRGVGSGVIITSDGYILTNNHVIEDAKKIEVAVPDGENTKNYTAEIIGNDPLTDVALIKIEAKGLKPATIGDSNMLRVGDVVLAAGAPMELPRSITQGIVSALGRSNEGIVRKGRMSGYEDFIQTDASINPGNSGGPLVDALGRVIGINTAILSKSGMNAGIGFAIPVNMVMRIAEDLLDDGSVQRGYLGVQITDVTPQFAKQYNIGDQTGALVTQVGAESPAEKAGLQVEDIVIGINGQKVDGSSRLRLIVSSLKPGSSVPMEILRNGQKMTVNATLEALPEEALAEVGPGRSIPRGGTGKGAANAVVELVSGVDVQNLSQALRDRYDIPKEIQGVIVTKVNPDSRAAAMGLEEGDVITHINRQVVPSATEARTLAKASEQSVLLRLYRKGDTMLLMIGNQ